MPLGNIVVKKRSSWNLCLCPFSRKAPSYILIFPYIKYLLLRNKKLIIKQYIRNIRHWREMMWRSNLLWRNTIFKLDLQLTLFLPSRRFSALNFITVSKKRKKSCKWYTQLTSCVQTYMASPLNSKNSSKSPWYENRIHRFIACFYRKNSLYCPLHQKWRAFHSGSWSSLDDYSDLVATVMKFLVQLSNAINRSLTDSSVPC